MKLKQSLLILSLVVLGVLFAACGGGGTPATKVNLTVTKAGSGSGTVTSQPAGIKDGTNTFGFDKGTKVTLTANAAADSTFAGFTNCTAVAGDANKCTVALNAATTVTATFNKKDTGGGDVVNSVTIVGGDQTVQVNTTVTLTANVDASQGVDTSVTWMSSNDAVATVDANGVVTTLTEGTTTITATSKADTNVSGTITLTVSAAAPAPAVNGVTIDQISPNVGLGKTTQLTATVDATGGADTSVTWMSDNTAVATVDANTGVVTGVTEGTAVITATSTFDPSKFGTTTVTVNNAATTVTTFEMSSGNDDAEEFIEKAAATAYPKDSTYTKSKELDLTTDTTNNRGNQLVGLRFPNVTIPKGATITSAYIQFTAKAGTSGAVTYIIKVQDADNAAAFVDYTVDSTLKNISSRPVTGNVTWSPAGWKPDEAAAAEQTVDIASLIKTTVDRPGWASGNAIAFVISGPSATLFNNTRQAKAFENLSGSAFAPKLIVTYQ